MSLFSRFFRKASTPPETPEKPLESADLAPPAPSVPDRALLAAREEEALRAAIRSNDAGAVARLVIEGASTKIRQAAAQAIEDPATLRRLIRDARGGKDKSVYRILTSKRDALLLQERKTEHLQAEISAVSAALERHSHRTHDPLFAPTLEQLEGRWKAVAADAAPSLREKVERALDRSREVIAEHLRQIAVANAAAQAQRLRDTQEKAAAEAAAERARILDEQKKAQLEKREAETLALRQVGGLIRKALGALNEGSTGRAAGLRRAIEEKLSGGAPPLPAHLPAYLSSQLQQLDTRLNELKDWKSFSVAPKRAELMQEMQSLAAGSTLDPPVLAERIKSLQEQWRTLSKGAGENLEADWQRFQEAAQTAYQPCREYFEAQARLRQENLQRREALLARLAAFEAGHDWEQPDWRTVLVALRESKQDWRRYSPVERAAGKALQERFVAVTARLQGRLDAEHAANLAAKKSLIERAQQLGSGEDSRQSIEEVKELQRRWKSVGPVPRDADHRLWEEFRQHCDAVFQRRQQDFAEYTAGLEASRSRALGMCDELERIAASSGPELLENAHKLSDLRLAFEAIGEFPRGGARELWNRFERALERCEEAVARQKAREVERSWADLFEAGNRVLAYKLALVRDADGAEPDVSPEQTKDDLRQQAEDYVASVSQWPKGGLQAIRKELASEPAGDPAANEEALRLLCVRAEILCDMPTPPEDQPLRRQYQVQRLMQSMGQGIKADETQLDTLAMEWIRVGPTEGETYMRLLERFKRCRQR